MPGQIQFFNADVKFAVPGSRTAKSWLKKVISTEGSTLDYVDYIFCSDTYLLEINQTFLHHNTYTDIITFDLSESPFTIAGEIYISVDRINENASKFGVELNEELYRVMVHGVLHLLGYTDKGKRQKADMRKKEDACLSLLPRTDSST